MTYGEFISLEKGDTVEDKDGVLGEVDSIDILADDVWVKWEDTLNGEIKWSNYREIIKY